MKKATSSPQTSAAKVADRAGGTRPRSVTGSSGSFEIGMGPSSKPPVSKPATTAELDESMKKLQRTLTGTDDTGQWAVVVDADAAISR